MIDESILLDDESLLMTEMNRYVQADENGTCQVARDAAGGARTHRAACAITLTLIKDV